MVRRGVYKAFVAAAFVMLVVLVGATYQGVATALERRQFQRPGRLVDVGGHQLHIYCLGEGAPPVVLEAPATGMSGAWGWVQPHVARSTRVCSYDRSGLGWSERTDGPYDPAAAAAELRLLLEGAGERGPFVVAGHGLGAAFAALFASRYAADMAALILIDPPVAGEAPAERNPAIRFVGLTPWLARSGLLRASRMLSRTAAGLPPLSGGALTAFLNRPDHLTRAAQELSRWDDVVVSALRASTGNEVRVIRLDAVGKGRVAFLADEPAATAVATAILEAVQQVRATR